MKKIIYLISILFFLISCENKAKRDINKNKIVYLPTDTFKISSDFSIRFRHVNYAINKLEDTLKLGLNYSKIIKIYPEQENYPIKLKLGENWYPHLYSEVHDGKKITRDSTVISDSTNTFSIKFKFETLGPNYISATIHETLFYLDEEIDSMRLKEFERKLNIPVYVVE